MLLSKIKIHEVAKKIGVNSKEVLEKALELGLDVKNHMSSIEEEEAKKIESKFSNKKEAKEKQSGPVIIRREVIVSDQENERIKDSKKPDNRNNREVGFIERERKTDYNIVYRNKHNKPLTVSELFGKKAPSTEKKENTDTIIQKILMFLKKMITNKNQKLKKNYLQAIYLKKLNIPILILLEMQIIISHIIIKKINHITEKEQDHIIIDMDKMEDHIITKAIDLLVGEEDL